MTIVLLRALRGGPRAPLLQVGRLRRFTGRPDSPLGEEVGRARRPRRGELAEHDGITVQLPG
eukprot:896394-Alexandrium_andersonii.AAC.1